MARSTYHLARSWGRGHGTPVIGQKQRARPVRSSHWPGSGAWSFRGRGQWIQLQGRLFLGFLQFVFPDLPLAVIVVAQEPGDG